MSRQTICREYTIEIFLEQKIIFFIYSCLYLRGLNNEFFLSFYFKSILFIFIIIFFSSFFYPVYIYYSWFRGEM